EKFSIPLEAATPRMKPADAAWFICEILVQSDGTKSKPACEDKVGLTPGTGKISTAVAEFTAHIPKEADMSPPVVKHCVYFALAIGTIEATQSRNFCNTIQTAAQGWTDTFASGRATLKHIVTASVTKVVKSEVLDFIDKGAPIQHLPTDGKKSGS